MMFLEQEAIAEEQTISSQEQGMTQQGDETCVVETISYAPRFSLFFLQACSLRQFSNQINHYIDREQIATAYLSIMLSGCVAALASRIVRGCK